MFVKKAVVQTEEVYTATHTFADFGLHRQLQRNIEARGYLTPTPIQDQAIPHLLEGRDLIGLANTGTGKTAAFLVPLINKVAENRDERVLIVAPTRELAVQIEQEYKQFSHNLGLYSALCIGGVSMYNQIYKLERNPEFVIGTPGRLKDLEQQGVLRFSDYNNIVLDEVDQMFDMGFIKDVKYMISKLSQPRQSLFFSATLTDALQQIMQGFLNNPIKVSVKSREAAQNIDQDIVRLNGKPKLEVLYDLLAQDDFDKVLVFSRTKRGTEKLAQSLYDQGFAVDAIHGNKSQNQRQRAIDHFKRSRVKILVATDVASRGLDIDNVSHVINFDLPETYQDYIHRIGRTGRANKKGIALTFID
ncbi:MAG TPA: DEAD/DEAH box helicase [Vitreimonas sp.]|nr:DEAD/DEAH box helicase [Vitreimonas sp.]